MARMTAFVVGAVAIAVAILLGPSQRRVPCRSGFRGCCVGESAGDRSLAVLEAVQYERRCRRLGDRSCGINHFDLNRTEDEVVIRSFPWRIPAFEHSSWISGA